MALTAQYFTTDGSAREFGTTVGEEYVTGTVKGLAGAGVATAATAMQVASSKLASDGYGRNAPHPSDASKTRVEAFFSGYKPSGDTINFRLRYSTFQGEVTTSLIVNLSSGLEQVQSPFLAATKETMVVGWSGRTSADGPTKPISPKITPDILKLADTRPIIRLSGTKVFYGNVQVSNLLAASSVIGGVNDKTFLGRPKGQWMMKAYDTSQNKYGGTIAIRLEAWAKGTGQVDGEDWRSAGVLFNEKIGKYAAIDPQKYAAALAAPYVFGIIQSSGSGQIYNPITDGFLIAGQKPLVNFDDIWTGMGVESDVPPFGFGEPSDGGTS